MFQKDMSESAWDKLKMRCKTDLFFLGHDVLEKRFTERTHRAMCDFYVKKDPSYETFRHFADAYEGPKDRLQLVPRKAYKSTIKVIDNIQWHICWPDVSIMCMTATNGLASSFVSEFQSYLIVYKGERNPKTGRIEGGSPTLFQELFPEFCITEKESYLGGAFTSPARKRFSKEPTIGAISIQQSGSGWSCDLLDFDDVLSDDNTETGLQLEKLEKRIAMATNLRKKFGFRHIVGTRYHPLDAYGKLAESNGIVSVYGDFTTEHLAYLCRPCWWLKGQPYKQPEYKTWKPNPDDVELFFPEDLTFKIMAKELREQPEVFFSQELNDPIEAANVQFTEELVRSCFVDHTSVPKEGTIYMAWDLAYGTASGRDYTVGAAGLLDSQGRWFIIGLVRDRFNPTETAQAIVNNLAAYKPRRASIEDSVGTKWMLNDIDMLSKEQGVSCDLDWICLGQGTEDAKMDRMVTLHPLMTGRRLFFVNTLIEVNEIIKEFRNVGTKRTRNDIPDAISRLTLTYQSQSNQATYRVQDDERAQAEWNELADQRMSDMLFCKGKYAPVEPVVEPEPEYYTDPVTGLPSPHPY